MGFKYILININNGNIDGYYFTFIESVSFLKKYNGYIFRCKSDKDIFYINHPLEHYYSSEAINIIDDNNKEETVLSYSHIEVRLTNKFPSIRVGVTDI
jgi:hypothetical protein